MRDPAALREALLEGARIELIPCIDFGWYGWIEAVDETIEGRTAAEVFLKIADLLSLHVDGVAVQ